MNNIIFWTPNFLSLPFLLSFLFVLKMFLGFSRYQSYSDASLFTSNLVPSSKTNEGLEPDTQKHQPPINGGSTSSLLVSLPSYLSNKP